MLNGKPASLVTRVDGAPMPTPDVVHCAAVGAALGRLHRRVGDVSPRLHQPPRPVVVAAGGARRASLHRRRRRTSCSASELKFLTGFAKVRMPRGAIHGDLFCDNVLFVGDRVSGIIDFGFRGDGFPRLRSRDHRQRLVHRRRSRRGALVPELVDGARRRVRRRCVR